MAGLTGARLSFVPIQAARPRLDGKAARRQLRDRPRGGTPPLAPREHVAGVADKALQAGRWPFTEEPPRACPGCGARYAGEVCPTSGCIRAPGYAPRGERLAVRSAWPGVGGHVTPWLRDRVEYR